MIHPECEFIDQNNIKKLEENLTPVYPITEGLQQNKKFHKQSLKC